MLTAPNSAPTTLREYTNVEEAHRRKEDARRLHTLRSAREADRQLVVVVIAKHAAAAAAAAAHVAETAAAIANAAQQEGNGATCLTYFKTIALPMFFAAVACVKFFVVITDTAMKMCFSLAAVLLAIGVVHSMVRSLMDAPTIERSGDSDCRYFLRRAEPCAKFMLAFLGVGTLFALSSLSGVAASSGVAGARKDLHAYQQEEIHNNTVAGTSHAQMLSFTDIAGASICGSPDSPTWGSCLIEAVASATARTTRASSSGMCCEHSTVTKFNECAVRRFVLAHGGVTLNYVDASKNDVKFDRSRVCS